MAKITFKSEECKGCGLCVKACPKGIVRLSDKFNKKGYSPAMVTDESECTGCKCCAIMCPDCVITIEK